MRTFAVVACVGFVLVGAAACWADDIPLPSSLEIHPRWREMFPPGNDCYVQKNAMGGLAGIHGRDRDILRGPSVVLYESGGLKMLGGYAKAARDGTFRMWDKEGAMILYAQFKEGKPHGLVVIFREKKPWLVQEWKAGELQRESTDDADAHAKLAEIGADLAATEKEVRKSLRDWFAESEKQRKAENVAALKPAAHAARVANSERTKQEGSIRLPRHVLNLVSAARPVPLPPIRQRTAGPPARPPRPRRTLGRRRCEVETRR